MEWAQLIDHTWPCCMNSSSSAGIAMRAGRGSCSSQASNTLHLCSSHERIFFSTCQVMALGGKSSRDGRGDMSGMAMDMNCGGEPGLQPCLSEPLRKRGHRSLFQVREGGRQPAKSSDKSNEAESFICGLPLSGCMLWGWRMLAQSLSWRRLMTV